jgi:beta-glucanase (GH16 family)
VTGNPKGGFLRQPYGFVQFTARVPSGSGLWSTLSTLPAKVSWPPETDIASVLGSEPGSARYCYHPIGTRHVVQVSSSAAGNRSKGWHTFAVNWEPGSITWYTDGRQAYRYLGVPPDVPMYLLADLVVENVYGSGPTSSGLSVPSLAIKNVKVYQSPVR